MLRVEPELAFLMVYMHLFNYFLIDTVFGGKKQYGVGDDAALEVVGTVFLQGMLAPGAAARVDAFN
jgi:hypothetical protein